MLLLKEFLTNTKKSDAAAAARGAAAAAAQLQLYGASPYGSMTSGMYQVHGLMPTLSLLPLTSPTQDPSSHQVQLLACGPEGRVAPALQTCGVQDPAL